MSRVYDMPPLSDWEYWPSVTDVPCPVEGCTGHVISCEAGNVPGYRVCMQPLADQPGCYDPDTIRHHFFAGGNAKRPTLILDEEQINSNLEVGKMTCYKTFREVYQEARAIYLDIDDASAHSPMDPVVRLENGKWTLDSGLYSDEHTDLKCTLDQFDTYWYDGYEDSDIPSETDMLEFLAMLERAKRLLADMRRS